jgi:hypothetical protein
MSDDLEFLRLNMPKEELPEARPQHLKFCRDLMDQKDWSAMAEGMPRAWRNLASTIESGENTFNGKPILRTDVNKLIDELKKCPAGKKPRRDAIGNAEKAREAGNHAMEMWREASKTTTPRPDAFASQELLEDGIYRKPDGTIYRVYFNLAETHLLAKKLIIVSKGDMERGKPAKVKWEYAGAARRFVKLSEKMPYEEAKDFGALYGICIFGHPLNDPVSIHLGIGPICGRRQFGEDFEFMIDQAKIELGQKRSRKDQLADIDRQIKELDT